ncbi:hypothetical protein [Candidatus Sororendozoicomonas aggregata]
MESHAYTGLIEAPLKQSSMFTTTTNTNGFSIYHGLSNVPLLPT